MNRAALVACAALVALSIVGAPAAEADRPGAHGAVIRVEHQPFEEAPAIGPRDALVTIELYFTPGSPESHNAYRVLVELQRLHPTRIRAVFRPREISAQVIIPAITLAAHAHGKFFALMSELTRTDSAPSGPATAEIAVRLGLDRALVATAHVDDAIADVLKDNSRRYFRLGATSLPAMVLNGRLTAALYDRTITLPELEGEYKNALDAARFALGQGVPRRALAEAGARHSACGDPADSDEDDEQGHVAAGGVAEPAPIAEAPAFNWHLGALTSRGTGCPPARHVGGRLDDYDAASPPDVSGAYLLSAPIPTAGLPAFGPSDAPVTMQVACNLRGSACQEQLERARRLAEQFPGSVRVVFVPWIDLALENHDTDLVLAEAALCATSAGDGYAFIRAATGRSMPPRKPADLAALAQVAGLDADALVRCAQADAPRTRAILAAERTAGIGWGPTVVIGGRAYVGGFSDDRPAAEVIEAELGPGLLEDLVPTY